MTARFTLTLSDDLNEDIDKVVSRKQTTKNEVMRKALQLYLAAEEGEAEGKKVGLVNPETRVLETEFIGL